MKKPTSTDIVNLALEAGFRCDYSGVYIPYGEDGISQINELVRLACAKQREQITQLIFSNARACSGVTRDILLSQIAAIELLEFSPNSGDNNDCADSPRNS